MTEFAFFGGKGGVGKTTVASAHGLDCARRGRRVLLVSTDPAHSTSDVFDQQFGDEPRPVEGVDGLDALEIDPDREVEAHMQEIKRRLTDQVSPALVNEIDRQIELAHRTPGAYEAALFDRIVDVMRAADGDAGADAGTGGDTGTRDDASSGDDDAPAGGRTASGADLSRYDRIVFDTSPTGSTLRLLSLPEYLESWVQRLLDKRRRSIDLYEKAAIGDKRAERSVESDPIIDHLRARKAMFEYARETLPRAEYYLVLNPDELSIQETRRSVETLADYGLSVDGLVINRVTPMPDPDERGRGATFLREKAERERDRIDEIRETFAQPVVAELETRTAEIKGELLKDVAAELAIEVGTK